MTAVQSRRLVRREQAVGLPRRVRPNAAGTLASPVQYTSYDIPEPVEVADLNLDGKADVVSVHGGWLRAGIYLQGAGGSLGSEDLPDIPYASHYNPHGLAVGDVDGNGSPDVVIADSNNGLVILPGTAPPNRRPRRRARVGILGQATEAVRVRPQGLELGQSSTTATATSR